MKGGDIMNPGVLAAIITAAGGVAVALITAASEVAVAAIGAQQ